MSGVYIPSHIRAARRMTGFLLFLIGVALTVGLYYVKTRAQTARKHAVKIERQIAQEEASLRVLRAEIAYLENPARLKSLSEAHLGLQSIAVKDVFELKDIAVQFPLREDIQSEGGSK